MTSKTLTKSQVILIVDDQIENRHSITQHLQEASTDYEILTAPNGQVALNVAQHLRPQLIITDWDMPKMNGLALTQALKQNELTRHTPVLVVTGVYTSNENLQLALQAGATDYIRKPIQKLELCARVATALALQQSFEVIRKQHEALEAQQKRALSSKAFEIYKKNELLKKIRQIATQQKDKADHKVASIVKIVDQHHTDDEWLGFRQYFEQIHPDFFAKLQKQCNELTTEDLKHCAFVRAHMSTKEIAQLLNIHINSVRTHHYRIRKKLKLSNDIRFADYIIGITV